MANSEKPDFNKYVLDAAERAQSVLSRTRLGERVIRAFTGSDSPAYVQLDWESRNMTTVIKNTVRVPGDPTAGRLARNWHNAMVMALDEEELRELASESGAADNYRTAVAYVSEDIAHIGTNPNVHQSMFSRYSDQELAVAMRLGNSALEATAGLWLPGERAFVGVENVRIIEPSFPVAQIRQSFPDILLA